MMRISAIDTLAVEALVFEVDSEIDTISWYHRLDDTE